VPFLLLGLDRGRRMAARGAAARQEDASVAGLHEEGDDPGWASWAIRPHWAGCNRVGFSGKQRSTKAGHMREWAKNENGL
jgi:hypothetical protein